MDVVLRRRVPRLACLVGLLALVAGCGQPLYVARLGWEEARLLWRRQPIPDLLARSDLDPALRERLELVLAARAFADERLGLRVGDSYGTFAEVDARGVVHVLQAARRDRLESHTWWYPVAGRVPYRGFFDAADAEAAGDRLAADGLDVDVRPAIAFSTLGWFADPLLSSTAEGSPEEVVETVLHELFHATVYVPGEPAFNESAATFAGHRGAIAFFCDGPGFDAARCARTREAWRAMQARGVVLGRLAAKLRRLYERDPPERVREQIRGRLAARAGRALEAQRAGRLTELVPPNNARLLGALIYVTDLDAFQALAPDESDPGPAIRALAATANGSGDPFAQVRALSPDDLEG